MVDEEKYINQIINAIHFTVNCSEKNDFNLSKFNVSIFDIIYQIYYKVNINFVHYCVMHYLTKKCLCIKIFHKFNLYYSHVSFFLRTLNF